MRRQALVCVVLAVLALFGCRFREDQPVSSLRLVRQIVVICEDSNERIQRTYHTEDKMRFILLFLRSVGIQDQPDIDPETVRARTISISISFSDGSSKLYRIKGDRYFQEGTAGWKQIQPEKITGLYQSILSTPSDPEKKETPINPRLPFPDFRQKMPE